MAPPGELKGLDGTTCASCGAWLDLDVQRSAAGWYLGYFRGTCGPYSRETSYFVTRKEAQDALYDYLENYEEPANLRDTKWHEGGVK